MPTKPPHLRREFAERFKDPEVVVAYRARPRYPPETFQVLGSLAGGLAGRVLDVGCGTGVIARGVAPLVAKVEAVDPSEPMIKAARGLPGGDRPNILWRIGRVEEVELQPPFSMIVGAQSLHWTDWDVVFAEFRRVLSPDGFLAVVDMETESKWDVELQRIIAKFSTNPDYRPYDMVAAWREAACFEKHGEWRSEASMVDQSLDDYLQFLHSMSSLTRSSMGSARSRAFDDEVRDLLGRHSQLHRVSYEAYCSVVWGRVPTPGNLSEEGRATSEGAAGEPDI